MRDPTSGQMTKAKKLNLNAPYLQRDEFNYADVGGCLPFDSTAVWLFGREIKDVNRVALPGSPRGSPVG